MISMLGVWRAHGIDRILREAWERGIVLCGLSAGSLCWFEECVTTYQKETRVTIGLGLLPWSNRGSLRTGLDCPQGVRGEVEGRPASGIRGDRRCRLPLHRHPELAQVVASRPEARAYRIELKGDRPKQPSSRPGTFGSPDQVPLVEESPIPWASTPMKWPDARQPQPQAGPAMKGRILVMGGHEFDRLDGNEAIVEHVISLTGMKAPKICLLPTASGDPEEPDLPLSPFLSAVAVARSSDISLYFPARSESDGCRPPDETGRDLRRRGQPGQPGRGLEATWNRRADRRMPRARRDGGGTSAGAMCWFEAGITSSSGRPEPAEGLGVLKGSLCVHYHRDPERRTRYLAEVGKSMPAGYRASEPDRPALHRRRTDRGIHRPRGSRGVEGDPVPAQGGVEEPVEAVAIRPKPKPDAPGDRSRASEVSEWRVGALLDRLRDQRVRGAGAGNR